MCTHSLRPPSGSRSKLMPSSISVVEASSIVKTEWVVVKSRRAAASGSGGGEDSSCCASACGGRERQEGQSKGAKEFVQK